jgi:hypothetical protein
MSLAASIGDVRCRSCHQLLALTKSIGSESCAGTAGCTTATNEAREEVSHCVGSLPHVHAALSSPGRSSGRLKPLVVTALAAKAQQDGHSVLVPRQYKAAGAYMLLLASSQL